MNLSSLWAESCSTASWGQTYVACSSWARPPARAMIDVGRSGSIINMSSILGQVAMQRTSIYAATKGAPNQLTR
jgi:short-subunit dehydrogenase